MVASRTTRCTDLTDSGSCPWSCLLGSPGCAPVLLASDAPDFVSGEEAAHAARVGIVPENVRGHVASRVSIVTLVCVQLVAKTKLVVGSAESASLLAMMERVNAARTWIAAEAMALPVADRRRRFALQRALYHRARALFDLPSQATVRALASVAACFERDPRKQPTFRPHAAIDYDARNLTFRGAEGGTPTSVTLATLEGRTAALPLLASGPHAARLAGDRGASALVLRKGRWYLHTAVDVPTPEAKPASGWLGVDLGIVHLATDSDGTVHTGAVVERVRDRMLTLRTALQAKGTRSARRHLQKLAGREARFRRDVNHRISKCLARSAEGTGRGIALEDLQGIRDRVTVRHTQRARHSSWAFHQLRFFVEYKARAAGVPVVAVDPRNTSRTCPACGCCDRRNRPDRDTFRCIACGHTGAADHVAAINISQRAAANRPIVSGSDRVKPAHRVPRVAQGQAPRFSEA